MHIQGYVNLKNYAHFITLDISKKYSKPYFITLKCVRISIAISINYSHNLRLRKSLQVMGRSQIPRWIGYLFLSFQSWMLMANMKNGKECLLLLRELFFFHVVLVRSSEVCISTNPDGGQCSCRRYHENISICGTWYEDLCSCLRLVQFCSILK